MAPRSEQRVLTVSMQCRGSSSRLRIGDLGQLICVDGLLMIAPVSQLPAGQSQNLITKICLTHEALLKYALHVRIHLRLGNVDAALFGHGRPQLVSHDLADCAHLACAIVRLLASRLIPSCLPLQRCDKRRVRDINGDASNA
jgi:hypothetical protein